MTNEIKQTEDYLKYLSIGFYCFGGLVTLFSLIWLIYIVFGLAMVVGGGASGEAGAIGGGIFLILFGVFIMAIFLTIAGLNIFAARSLTSRSKWTFIFVVGCIDLVIFVPIGTIIGILTIVLLLQEPTKQLFGRGIQQIPNTSPDWR